MRQKECRDRQGKIQAMGVGKPMDLIHGGDLYGAALQSRRAEGELLDFSSNINPLGVQPKVREAVSRAMERVEQYPDPLCRRLVAALAEKERVREEQLLCGNGGADLIYRFAYGLRPKKAMLPAPAFAEYEEALRQVDTEMIFQNLNHKKQVDDAFVEALPGDVDAVFLCNPNNPTGLLTERGRILKLLEKAGRTGTLVFLDECFLDFAEEDVEAADGAPEGYTLKDYLEEFPNLVILKSFTKMYAIPGLRLGYVLSSDRGLLERMRLAGQPWSVGGLAQEAGIAALEDAEFPRRTREFVKRERSFLKAEMEKLGFFVYDGAANYLCFCVPGERAFYEKMLEQGIVIRRCGNYRNLDAEHYRVAVRAHEENRRLLEAFRTVLHGKGSRWEKRMGKE